MASYRRKTGVRTQDAAMPVARCNFPLSIIILADAAARGARSCTEAMLLRNNSRQATRNDAPGCLANAFGALAQWVATSPKAFEKVPMAGAKRRFSAKLIR
ncbi:MAG TPA: hypothetical protein VGL90_10805 [Casimicrobiaceae bacterium]